MNELNWDELVAVGRIARAQGRKGEVAVDPLTDDPERFRLVRRLFMRGSGAPLARELEWARLHKGRPVLKFVGISDIGAAERLRGEEVRIPLEEVRPLEEEAFYHFQIEGCEVFDNRAGHLGVVTRVQSTGGVDLLVVETGGGDEVLVPFCKDICRIIDVVAGRIDLEAPEGLVSLNAG